MEATAEKLVRDVRVVVQDAEDLIRATAGDIEDKTREARAKLAGALVVAKETLNQAEHTAAERLRAARRVISDSPYQTLGLSFVFGLVCGLLLARR
jgi:ElaB/YqjD/DUF883 family membrane-anchored ribosome-binding protein